MNYTLEDFQNVLCLRYQLVTFDEKKLLELYQDYDKFVLFLDTVAVLSNVDSAFLLLSDEIADKIISIISIHRFSLKDNALSSHINDIITYLNQIKAREESINDLLKFSYCAYQEEVRGVSFEDKNLLLSALAHDYVTFIALKEGRMDYIENDLGFLFSINYLIETCPELFSSSEIKNLVSTKLKELDKKGWPFNRDFRRYSRNTEKHLEKKQKS